MSVTTMNLDLSAFTRSAKKHIGTDWPNAVVDGFSDIAASADEAVTDVTRLRFGLHSEYIPRGIRHYPQTQAQKNAAAKAMKRYGDMNAAVYVRPARDPKKSLGFMVDHEEGEQREPQDKWIASPTAEARRMYSMRTARGKMKRRFMPSELLKRFRSTGSYYDGQTTLSRRRNKWGRTPGVPFLMYSSRANKTFIVRRASKSKGGRENLQFLYVFLTKAYINRKWGFEITAKADVYNKYAVTIDAHTKRMPDYK